MARLSLNQNPIEEPDIMQLPTRTPRMRRLRPMTLGLLAFVLAAPLATAGSVHAAELAVQSKISAVIVYPSGAEVSRTAKVSLPAGNSTLVFRDLPDDIRRETIRIEGVGTGDIVIGSVETARQILTEAEREAIASAGQDLRDKIEVERQTLTELAAMLDVKTTQKTFLQNLATLPTNPGVAGRGGTAGGTDWAQMFALIGTNMANVQTEILELKKRQKDAENTIADLERELERVAVRPREAILGKVEIESDTGSEAEFTLRYAVRGASWTPLYDARLTTTPGETGKPSLQLIRRAAVRQSTSEPWTDVALTLSTVRPGGRTAAPPMRPVSVDFAPPPQPAATVAAAPRAQLEAMQDRELSKRIARSGQRFRGVVGQAARPARVARANVTVGSFQASYAITGVTTIANNNAVRNLTIDSQAITPELKVLAAPRLDKRAYLYAAFTLPEGTPFLKGTVSLFRDNTYVGRGRLPELAGGTKHELGFGADDLIKVTFTTRDEKRGETGIISSSKTDRRAFRFEITNLHDRAIAYTILDRLPKSRNDDIQVERFGKNKPSRMDVDDKQGVVAWDGKLDANAEKSIDFGYLISWPADKRVVYR